MPTITRPTKITKSSATLIDTIFVSQTLCGNYSSSILVDDISDHLPSICIIKSLKSVKNKSIQIKSRDTCLRNITALQNNLSKYDWQTLLREKEKDVSVAMDKFHKVLQYEIDLCIPETTRVLNSKNVRREPWLSVNLEYNGNVVSNSLAKYFSMVGKKFADKIPNSTRNVKEYLSRLQGNTSNLFFEPCTITEVRRTIKNLSAKKSSGADGISNDLLKILADSIAEPLCMVINESMSTGKFPELMKLAEVVPLYKGKARDIEMNYRPISLLTTMSKVMEKVIYTRVYTFLTKTGQICETQYGFRSNHSCEHAVYQLIGTVLKNLENKKVRSL